MAKTLGEELRAARDARGLSLRAVERATGIHNAHLSQIETDSISRPDLAILWELSSFYEMDYGKLMRLAGYAAHRATNGHEKEQLSVAFRTMGELNPQERKRTLAFMAELKKARSGGD
jgi:HTH-type transcriptional regulator, competence development regulator